MGELLSGWKRTALCADFTKEDIGKTVTVMGWVNARHDLGGLIFIDLRDRSGLMQIVFDRASYDGDFSAVEGLRDEYVIAVRGKIIERSEDTINPRIPTGYIEIRAEEMKVLSTSATPPFELENGSKVREDLRLKYRFFDLRRPELLQNFLLRNKITTTVRRFLEENGFIDVETPILQKSTPEGARDYLVPSRTHAGAFFALPQSPQLFKQLLMVSGFDRYYQIAKCFRDEDLRADRQPEFTQIDTEMSFVEPDDVMDLNERLLQTVFKEVIDVDLPRPFKRLTYQEAMDRYGSDKPDTRFGLELVNISDIIKDSEFKVFSNVVKKGGSVRAINAKGAADILPRREIDSLVDFVHAYGAKGMAWISLKEDGMISPITKFLSEDELNQILERTGAETGDILFFVGDTDQIVYDSLGALRLKLAERMDLIPEGSWDLLWVTDFPLLKYSEEEKRYVAEHHPFTAPLDEDVELLDTHPEQVRSKAYDIVCNGTELGGGSIRIHDADMQEKIFEILGLDPEDAKERFGFLLDAFQYGTPPHGGLAYGLDRMAMLMSGSSSIRDVIAFPKVQNASDLMTQAPTPVDRAQLRDLHISVDEKRRS